ncbi:hypothetical protein ACJMK2_040394 [Sinanodonta woodiana]|uniref:Serine/threonine-protein phosphatase 2A activator n=1 Tax=Sinanodonta woodiana TaxID=1069815 RepID=A0ABD3WGH3_SINWO
MAETTAESLVDVKQLVGNIDVQTHEFVTPKKEISLPEHIPKWERSQAYRDLMGFILTMNEAVKGKKIRGDYPVSETVKKLVALLDKINSWIDEIPPIEQPQRFGNKAFRQWFIRLKENAESLIQETLDEKYHRAIPEISVYLVEGFGNDTRIDYGTGHELSFAAFLCCLYKIGVFKEEDAQAVLLKIFERYLQVMRKLQLTYRMEPAGSHGVWSLDDHHFLPFIWGSSQLIDHHRIQPKSFVRPDIFEHFATDYMFLGCIKFINSVKTGPFAEHSNQLWNVSGVSDWGKVNTGLIKMYQAEVLAKYPVIQHFVFGSLLTTSPAS